jgi:hypothetical protein
MPPNVFSTLGSYVCFFSASSSPAFSNLSSYIDESTIKYFMPRWREKGLLLASEPFVSFLVGSEMMSGGCRGEIVLQKWVYKAPVGKAGGIPVAGYKSTCGTRDGVEGRFLILLY